MARHCERPACSGQAVVAYVIDPSKLLVSIDAPIPSDSSRMNVLCRRHADSLVVPKGWTINDNREKKQRLFSSPVTQKIEKNGSRPASKPQSKPQSKPKEKPKEMPAKTSPALFDASVKEIIIEKVIDDTRDSVIPIDPQETQALPWTPQFDRTGDLDGTLRARGRLLSRAFGHVDDTVETSRDQELIDSDHDQSHPEY